MRKQKQLAGLKIEMCQMKVIPGLPSINRDQMLTVIDQAVEKQSDILVFPEFCLTGYLIGDLFEDICFIKETLLCHEQLREATRGSKLVVVFGSVDVDFQKCGEDGRVRKYNAVYVLQDGRFLAKQPKLLHPKYRFFNDSRHFLEGMKLQLEQQTSLTDFLRPVEVETRLGSVQLGLMVCEDMWDADYFIKPAEILAKAGADLFINVSASPWTWQKTRKRHQVIKQIVEAYQKPFVYVNAVGIQNTGKNVIVFDGNSALYSAVGEVAIEIPQYAAGAFQYQLVAKNTQQSQLAPAASDASALYAAIRYGLKSFIETFPPSRRKVIIGLSGGIDSAFVAALCVDILGQENVYAYSLPSKFNSEATQRAAREIAENLGLTNYEIIPIDGITDVLAAAVACKTSGLVFENLQARVRMEILAASAQKVGGVYTSNANKIELAFGYGTLNGDTTGFLAPIGDLLKREVYQLAAYLNASVFGRAVIPQSCFDNAPTAELSANQTDPFDYGSVTRIGYHDAMVRAFVEFRLNPQWFLEHYIRGTLDFQLQLEAGTIAAQFPTAREFIKDLEQKWNQFFNSYFKRVQSAPVIVVSKRAFGTDLQESMVAANFTQRYYDLRQTLLARYAPKKKRVALFGGSFNPPGQHHLKIAARLHQVFDEVIVIPCGLREDKASTSLVSLADRRALVLRAFSGEHIDFYDFDNQVYTPTVDLQERYVAQYPDAEIWHVFGGDLVVGGRLNDSEVHHWDHGKKIWNELNFAIIPRPGYATATEDMPPSSQLIEMEDLRGSSTELRSRLSEQADIQAFVPEAVAEYITAHRLYQ